MPTSTYQMPDLQTIGASSQAKELRGASTVPTFAKDLRGDRYGKLHAQGA